MEQNRIVKIIVKAVIILVIVFTGWLTYIIFRVTQIPLVIAAGAAVAVGLRALMVKIDESANFLIMTTEERAAAAEKRKKILEKFSNLIIPAMAVIFIFFSSPSFKRAVKSFFNEAVKQAEKNEDKNEGAESLVRRVKDAVKNAESTKDGTVVERYAGGKKKKEYTVLNGKLEGKYSIYSQEGVLLQQWNYRKGMLEGESYVYYPSGKLQKVQPYKENKLHGMFRIYDENGKIIETRIYRNGVEIKQSEPRVSG